MQAVSSVGVPGNGSRGEVGCPTIGSNPSGITPLEFNVLIRPAPAEERTKGGLLIPEGVRDRNHHASERGEVIALAEAAFAEIGGRPQVGQTVAIVRYGGTKVTGRDGEEYRIVKDKDVLAIVEE